MKRAHFMWHMRVGQQTGRDHYDTVPPRSEGTALSSASLRAHVRARVIGTHTPTQKHEIWHL